MWTFLNQYTALFTLTIVALVHGSVHNCTKNQTHCIQVLKEIRESIKDAKNQSALLNKIRVTTTRDRHRCEKHVFCLAEKILEDASHKNKTVKQTLGKLTGLLKRYNEWTNETQCKLQESTTQTLTQFLCKLDRCACRAFNCTSLGDCH